MNKCTSPKGHKFRKGMALESLFSDGITVGSRDCDRFGRGRTVYPINRSRLISVDKCIWCGVSHYIGVLNHA